MLPAPQVRSAGDHPRDVPASPGRPVPYSFAAPSTLLRSRSNVPRGRCPAFRASSTSRQSENPRADRFRNVWSADSPGSAQMLLVAVAVPGTAWRSGTHDADALLSARVWGGSEPMAGTFGVPRTSWVSTKSSRRRVRPGRTPSWNARSAPSAASASMTPAHDCAPVVVSGAASGRPCDDVRSDI